jgi:hypothetical protein
MDETTDETNPWMNLRMSQVWIVLWVVLICEQRLASTTTSTTKE